MRVSVNVPIHAYQMIRGFCILTLLAAIISLGMEFYKTKDFVPVEARITDIFQKVDSGPRGSGTTKIIHYIKYTYEKDGSPYSIQQRTLFKFGKKIGDSTTIYCSPTAPQMVRDQFHLEICICGLVFLVVFILGMSKAIRIKQNL